VLAAIVEGVKACSVELGDRVRSGYLPLGTAFPNALVTDPAQSARRHSRRSSPQHAIAQIQVSVFALSGEQARLIAELIEDQLGDEVPILTGTNRQAVGRLRWVQTIGMVERPIANTTTAEAVFHRAIQFSLIVE
jgi:hypothetical protein